MCELRPATPDVPDPARDVPAGFTIDALPGDPTRRPFEIAMRCWKAGYYVRFGGDTIQLAPPFITTPAQIDELVTVLGEALDQQA